MFVDGERLDELPEALELRVDRDHKIFFKGERYRPELVVLRSESVDGKERLAGDVCAELSFVEVRRQVDVRPDPDEADPGGD